MKISLKWLAEYIDIQDHFNKPQDLSQLLTAAGLEVESIENLAKQFEFVVVGHILQKAQHPNADRLTVCQVSTGEGVVHQIVCGARNHSEGDRVVVALPGAILPGNFAIKRSKIRDIESGGMLCSEKELGLKSESEGILLLPPEAPVGTSFAQYMGLDDIIFELKVTPNRADCLSHFGLAREISALTGRPVQFPIESLVEDGGSTRSRVTLDLRASDLCPRYAARGVAGVKVGPSPAWLKRRLEAVGLKSINNVVDITNFVMMELGQPLHAFDLRNLKSGKIVIDRATSGEVFTTLDGTELKLQGDELTIRDGERAVALAGIVGGKNSGVQDDTSDVIIEAAYFTPGAVRRTARKFGIETDSSYRFARGTNPDAILLALNRAAQLMVQVAGGRAMGEHYDLYPQPIRRDAIEISLAVVQDRLGYKVEAESFVQWMKRLECQLEETGPGKWRVLPPLFRWDLAIDMDLVEEYARLNGYQNIPETLPALSTMPLSHQLSFQLEAKIRRLLQADCLQAVNYAFIGREAQERFIGEASKLHNIGLHTAVAESSVALVNPLNEDLGVMRAGLTVGLFKNVLHNQRHGISDGKLYELGFSHFAAERDGAKVYAEEHRLAFAFWGQRSSLWQKTESAPVVYALKGQIESLLAGLGISRTRWVQLTAKDAPEFLHPGQSAVLEFAGQPVGFLGMLHPSLADEHKVRDPLAIAELNLERLLQGQPKSPRYSRISKMPATERDLAFVMPRDLPAAAVEVEIRKVAGELLKEVRVFDVFSGANLGENSKSVAYRLIFQAHDTTLEDQKINDLSDSVVAHVNKKFDIQLR